MNSTKMLFYKTKHIKIHTGPYSTLVSNKDSVKEHEKDGYNFSGTFKFRH